MTRNTYHTQVRQKLTVSFRNLENTLLDAACVLHLLYRSVGIRWNKPELNTCISDYIEQMNSSSAAERDNNNYIILVIIERELLRL